MSNLTYDTDLEFASNAGMQTQKILLTAGAEGYKGSQVYLTASGYGTFTMGSGLKFAGFCITAHGTTLNPNINESENPDNSAGSSGDKYIYVRCDPVIVKNYPAVSITQAHLNCKMYGTDNATMDDSSSGTALIGTLFKYTSSTLGDLKALPSSIYQ